mmetsp:Transcript_31438/g.79118  ORF Transcript_31438/g.79118 Transcript_31438/m.79118 type:complete len:213 (-) Transcript_31438:3583-4221(-)
MCSCAAQGREERRLPPLPRVMKVSRVGSARVESELQVALPRLRVPSYEETGLEALTSLQVSVLDASLYWMFFSSEAAGAEAALPVQSSTMVGVQTLKGSKRHWSLSLWACAIMWEMPAYIQSWKRGSDQASSSHLLSRSNVLCAHVSGREGAGFHVPGVHVLVLEYTLPHSAHFFVSIPPKISQSLYFEWQISPCPRHWELFFARVCQDDPG